MTDTLSERETSEWVNRQFQKANQFLAEQGVLFDSVVIEQSRYLAPFVAVWKIKSLESTLFWVISGDLPTDAINADTAATARDVLHHFSLSWQLKAENLDISNTSADAQKSEFITLLRDRAEKLYELYNNEQLWQ